MTGPELEVAIAEATANHIRAHSAFIQAMGRHRRAVEAAEQYILNLREKEMHNVGCKVKASGGLELSLWRHVVALEDEVSAAADRLAKTQAALDALSSLPDQREESR